MGKNGFPQTPHNSWDSQNPSRPPPPKLGISVFRKPTSTDTTINFYSNRPLEHKLAAYRFLIERMSTLLSERNNGKRNGNP